MRMIGVVLGATMTLSALPVLPVLAQAQLPADDEILAILENRVDAERQGVGIVVGLVDDEGSRTVSYGTLALDDPAPADGDTLYELGSVTKIFTSLLLADSVVRGEVRLDQPVAELLPESATVPSRDGREITLLDLATQHSGLPRLPDTFDPADPSNPYADFTEEDLLAFLAEYELPREIGEAYEYSNLGFGLLGYALANEAGTDYGTLVRERILDPLGMDDTVLVVAADDQARYAIGHDASLEPVADWTWDVLAGAGVLRSTANDLNMFLEALTGRAETELAEAITLATTPQIELGDGVTEIGLGWMLVPLGEDVAVFHNGGTFGARAFVGYLRDAQIGVAALSNVATLHGVDDLGLHLLDPSIPLIEPRQAVEVDPAVFEGLEGEYALAPEITVTVFTEDERLFAQLTGQEAAQIFPESESFYFYQMVDAQIEFDVDSDGVASGLTLHQFGEQIPAVRVGD